MSIGVAGVSAGVGTRGGNRHQRVYDPTQVAAVLAGLADGVFRDNRGRGGLLITLDEMQVAAADDLALLAGILHQLNTRHHAAPVAFIGAGLPTTQQVMTRAGVTHPDRLFRFETLADHLPPADAALAIIKPAQHLQVTWHPDAVDEVLRPCDGHPAHLQLFAHAAWQAAPEGNRIDPDAVTRSAPATVELIHRQTLGPRWEQLTPRQREYLAALCVLGGTAHTAAIADLLGVNLQDRSRVRDELLSGEDIYTPSRGLLRVSMPMAVPLILAEYDKISQDPPPGPPLTPLPELTARRDTRHPGPPAGRRRAPREPR